MLSSDILDEMDTEEGAEAPAPAPSDVVLALVDTHMALWNDPNRSTVAKAEVMDLMLDIRNQVKEMT